MRKQPKAKVGAPKRRTTYHHGDLRRVLISTALKLAEEGDLSALTLREVARRAGVTHGAPYHHFPNKAALLAVLAEEGYRQLYTEQLQAVAKAGADPTARMQALGVAYVRFAVQHPGHFRVMYRTDIGERAEYPTLLEAAQLVFVQLTSTADGMIRARSLEVDLIEFVLAAWSVVHGLATLWVDGPLKHLSALTGNRSIEEIAAGITAMSIEQVATR
jgi:AcrR family transcriptional regulator